jgi:hypothetical protein
MCTACAQRLAAPDAAIGEQLRSQGRQKAACRAGLHLRCRPPALKIQRTSRRAVASGALTIVHRAHGSQHGASDSPWLSFTGAHAAGPLTTATGGLPPRREAARPGRAGDYTTLHALPMTCVLHTQRVSGSACLPPLGRVHQTSPACKLPFVATSAVSYPAREPCLPACT